MRGNHFFISLEICCRRLKHWRWHEMLFVLPYSEEFRNFFLIFISTIFKVLSKVTEMLNPISINRILDIVKWLTDTEKQYLLLVNRIPDISKSSLVVKFRTQSMFSDLWNYLALYFTEEKPHISKISRTLVGNTIVDHSDVVGATLISAAPTISSCST